MRVLYLKEKSRSGDRSYRGGVRRESLIYGRSGDRSYRGGVRRESPLGEVGIYGEVAIGRSLLQGRCQERVAIGEVAISYRGGVRRESPLGEVGIYGEVAIGRSLLQGRCQERVAIGGSWHLWGSRDREIAPTGEVSGESRHWGKLAFMERSRSGDRSYRGGVRRESPLGEVGIYGEVAIGRSLLQGRCQERVAIGGSWHLWRGRDREIAPTENLTEKRILRYSI